MRSRRAATGRGLGPRAGAASTRSVIPAKAGPRLASAAPDIHASWNAFGAVANRILEGSGQAIEEQRPGAPAFAGMTGKSGSSEAPYGHPLRS